MKRLLLCLMVLAAVVIGAVSAFDITGYVNDAETGNPIGGASVQYVDLTISPYVTKDVSTLAQGNYSATGFTFNSSGNLMFVMATATGYEPYFAYFYQITQTNKNLNITIKSDSSPSGGGITIIGVAREGEYSGDHFISNGYGAPISNAIVYIKDASTGVMYNVTTNVAGYYVANESNIIPDDSHTYFLFGEKTGYHDSPNYTVMFPSVLEPRYDFCMETTPEGYIVIAGGVVSGGIYGVTGDGLYKNDTWISTDRGNTWSKQSNEGGWPARELHSCAVKSDGTITLAGGYIGIPSQGNVTDAWTTTDYGKTWTQLTPNGGWGGNTRYAAALEYTDANTLLLASGDNIFGSYDLWTSPFDLWTSSNLGTTWVRNTTPTPWGARVVNSPSLGTAGPGCAEIVKLSDGTLVLIGANASASWRNPAFVTTYTSTDNGVTWSKTNPSSRSINPDASWLYYTVDDFRAVVLSNDEIVVAGYMKAYTHDAVYNSTDGGSTWQVATQTDTLDLSYKEFPYRTLFGMTTVKGDVVGRDRIVVTGGYGFPVNYSNPLDCEYISLTPTYLNDTWYSENGGATWLSNRCDNTGAT